MIQEDYVSFEVAKLLKEKGFKESTQFVWYEHFPSQNAVNNSEVGKPKRDYFYWEKEGERNSSWTNNSPVPFYISGEVYSCPTHQLAMKWLRNTHGIHIQAWCPLVDIDTNILGVKYNVVISNLKDYCLAFATDIEDNSYDSYEEAVDAGLEYTLEHLI